MDNENTGRKRGYWEWVPVLLAMLLSFSCVFTATAMALMSQPNKLVDASMLPVGTANYGQVDSDKERFAQLDEAIFADATQDSAGLHLTPDSSSEEFSNRETPIFLAFVTPSPSETPVPSPVVVTMNAPETAVPTADASLISTPTTPPTQTPRAIATSTSTRFATATLTPWPSVTSSVTPYPTPSLTYTPVPPQPTATSKPSNPLTSTPRPASTDTPVPTYTATPVLPTATATTVPPTVTNTPTATTVLPTVTNTPTATTIPPTATNTPTATTVPPTATFVPTATPFVNAISVALVNADTESVIPGFETMPNGITLDLTTLPTENLNVWVTLDPQYAHHVDVFFNGSKHHTESFYPYTFPGNLYAPSHPDHPYNDFWDYNFAPGNHTLTFQPFIDQDTEGTPLVFNFTVIRSSIP